MEMSVKGFLKTTAALSTVEHPCIGDIYHVEKNDQDYVYDGVNWNKLGPGRLDWPITQYQIKVRIREIQAKIKQLKDEENTLKIRLADMIMEDEERQACCEDTSENKVDLPCIISVKFTGGGKNKHIYSYVDLTRKCKVGDIINVPIGKYGHLSEAEVVAVDVKPEDTMPVDFLKEYEGEQNDD